MGGLTDITLKLVETFYSKDNFLLVIDILKNKCGNNLPFCENWSSRQLERIRFAAIKLSEGQLDRLQYAVNLACIDWRDLLVVAGFADDIDHHIIWAKEILR